MNKKYPGSMTPASYLQTDETTLLEFAPHWRLLQVFPREPRELGHNCGAMFYIAEEQEIGSENRVRFDMAALRYGGACLEEAALALSALIPLHPGKQLAVLMMRNTKSGERHDIQVIWQSKQSTGAIKKIRETDNLDNLLEHVSAGPHSASHPYFVMSCDLKRGQVSRGEMLGFETFEPYGTAIELLLRGKDVGSIVRVMRWGERKTVYRRSHFIKFASSNRVTERGLKETVNDVRARLYETSSLVGEFGGW